MEEETRRRRRKKKSSGDPSEGRVIDRRPPEGFEVRDGDRLTVLYNGAKLQIAPYSTIEIDGANYSRTLDPGDDARTEFDRIYAYLQDRCLEHARAKLEMFSAEMAEAKRKVAG